jgi:selenocysteine lyase/cysteine desulfurase
LVESTTHGLSLVAQAVPLAAGDRVLVADLEFIQVALPWLQQKERVGIEVDAVPHRAGRITVDDVAARMSPRTRVLSISSVQWSNGFRCDLDSLSALCRERGVWLVVDAIQQLGAIPLDVAATPVDIVVCGGHKWLNAPFGTGFLYIRRGARDRLRAPLGGYLSLETPEGGWGNCFQTPSLSPFRDYRFVSDARRYEIGGTSNYPGGIGLAHSVALINALGPGRIAERIVQLTDHLIGGLQPLGVELVTHPEPEHRSGIVTFSVGDAGANVALMERLLDEQVLVSVRYTSGVGGVRVSCHFYNTFADLDRLLGVVSAWVREHALSRSV